MAQYIEFPVTTSTAELQDQALAEVQAQEPGYSLAPGSVLTWIIEAVADMVVESHLTLAQVPAAIFRYAGTDLFDVPFSAGTFALGSTTWTFTDDLGITIPSNTYITIDDVAFRTTSSVTVLPGAFSTAAGEVQIEAVESGTDSNDLFGAAELLDPLSRVDTISVVGITSGGTDEETEEDYRDALRARIARLGDHLTVPRDFESRARELSPIARALVINGLNPGTDEIQTITFGGTASGGTFTLTYSGQTTASIPYSATAAQVQTALTNLSNIGPADVAVTGGPLPGTALSVKFQNALRSTNVSAMTYTSSLTGTSPTITIATPTAGAASSTSNERTVAVAVTDAAGEPVSAAIKTELTAIYEDKREVNFLSYVIDPTYSFVDITYTARALPGYSSADVEANIDAGLASFLSPAAWGEFASSWVLTDKVRYLEVAQVINLAVGVDYIESLTIALSGGSFGTTDLTLSGIAPLVRAGTITSTVNEAA